MHLYFHLAGLTIPTYGLMIASGVIVANLIAMFVLKKIKLDLNDFLILESYCFLGAFVGAKILYFIVSIDEIDWSRFFDIKYFNQLMLSGFVFYGGLIGGLLIILLGGKVHKIKSTEYIRNFVFLIPLIHSFGRIGCFWAGCCYGIPYKGIGAVIYPENSFAPSGINLFPVQLVEAIGLFIIASIILFLQIRYSWRYTVESYFILYAILRFGLERLRDDDRGIYYGLSTSQWISAGLLFVALVLLIQKKITMQMHN